MEFESIWHMRIRIGQSPVCLPLGEARVLAGRAGVRVGGRLLWPRMAPYGASGPGQANPHVQKEKRLFPVRTFFSLQV